MLFVLLKRSMKFWLSLFLCLRVNETSLALLFKNKNILDHKLSVFYFLKIKYTVPHLLIQTSFMGEVAEKPGSRFFRQKKKKTILPY
jgi:hypothetical protein